MHGQSGATFQQAQVQAYLEVADLRDVLWQVLENRSHRHGLPMPYRVLYFDMREPLCRDQWARARVNCQSGEK